MDIAFNDDSTYEKLRNVFLNKSKTIYSIIKNSSLSEPAIKISGKHYVIPSETDLKIIIEKSGESYDIKSFFTLLYTIDYPKDEKSYSPIIINSTEFTSLSIMDTIYNKKDVKYILKYIKETAQPIFLKKQHLHLHNFGII